MLNAIDLKDMKFFEGLDTNELETIAGLCSSVEFKAWDKIFNRGDRAEYFYIIKEGKVDLCFLVTIMLKEMEITVDTLQAGAVLGWSALSESPKLTLSAYCKIDCKFIQMRGEEVLSLCNKEHHLGYVIMKNLAQVVSRRLAQMHYLCEKEIEMNVPSFEGKRY